MRGGLLGAHDHGALRQKRKRAPMSATVVDARPARSPRTQALRIALMSLAVTVAVTRSLPPGRATVWPVHDRPPPPSHPATSVPVAFAPASSAPVSGSPATECHMGRAC